MPGSHPILDAIDQFDELGPRLVTGARDAEDRERACAIGAIVDDLARELDPVEVDRVGHLPPAVLERAAHHGLFSLMVPRANGGIGLSPQAMATVATALARANGSLAMVLCAHNGLAMHAVLAHGSAQLKAEWLGPISRGEALLAFALTEPLAGNDLASLGTTLVPDGDSLRLTGEKCFITNGGRARFAVVVARTPGAAAGPFTLSLVDLTVPGVIRGAEENKLGLRGVSNVRFRFEGARVPAHHVLGQVGAGWEHAQTALQLGRTLVAAACVGAAEGALAITRRYLDERHRYGKPLSALAMVRGHVALAEAQRLALETVVRVAALACDAGRLSAWSTIAKISCTEIGWQLVDTMLGLHGGLGFMEPTGLARYLRDGRASRIFEGPNDLLRVRLAMEHLVTEDLPPLPKLQPRCDAALSAVAGALDAALARLFDASARMRAKYRLALVRRQADCGRLADATIELAAAVALVTRVHAELGGGDADPVRLARCALFCRHAITRSDQLLDRLESEVDALVDAAY